MSEEPTERDRDSRLLEGVVVENKEGAEGATRCGSRGGKT